MSSGRHAGPRSTCLVLALLQDASSGRRLQGRQSPPDVLVMLIAEDQFEPEIDKGYRPGKSCFFCSTASKVPYQG
ncbi:hypothetical protein CORC01_04633 [Colletotrichum orchidophilum]|uniref:Uncharacterized protein n=1 Tax=Colletotrichum orchidophilum TaxID=1209926 RepID=A0A1G4BF55_9PEZI|nr:uncharacterized protein CORC01_04633 [Colletotrichum orchidophilum]OHE99986.1 hypothetical protein CORC01_04633 [Colletotrichum orchidophilum]